MRSAWAWMSEDRSKNRVPPSSSLFLAATRRSNSCSNSGVPGARYPSGSCATSGRPAVPLLVQFATCWCQKARLSALSAIPALDSTFGVAENREAVVRVHTDLLELRVAGIDAGHNAVHPVPVVHFGIAVIAAGFLLQAQCRGVRVVAVARILTGAVGAHEPLARLGELDLVLVEFDVAQREPVVALVDRGAESAVESVYQLGGLVGLLRLRRRCNAVLTFRFSVP